MSPTIRINWNSPRFKAARDKWDALPDKTWEEGTGFVDNPEKKNWRWGFLNYLEPRRPKNDPPDGRRSYGNFMDRYKIAGRDWRRAQWDQYKPADWNRTPRGGRYNPAQIKTALQQLANHGKRQAIQRTYAETHGKPSPGRAAQQQHAATHGKPIHYPTGEASALKINKTGTTPSADEPMSMSGTDDTMQIGGKKRKPDTPSAGHNMSINI